MEQEVVTTNVILKELREFRAENNERWKKNDKRWEENDKKWQANEKRWEENEKRWKENEKRWIENERKWEENNKRWDENAKSLREMIAELNNLDGRVGMLEKNRETDRKALLNIFSTMEESIISEISRLEYKMDVKINRIDAILKENELEHGEFKNFTIANRNEINLQNIRIKRLEEWRKNFGLGEFAVV